MNCYFLFAVVYFTPGLLACSLPPFTRFYTVTERTILAPIVVHARVINTTRSEIQTQSKYEACIEVEKVIKERQHHVPQVLCLGKFGPDFLCLVHVRAGSSYIFFIDDDFTAKYDGVPAAVVEASDRAIQQAERGSCNPLALENQNKCELPTIESSFKRFAYPMEGENIELPCVHTGTPPRISKWTKDGAPLLAPRWGLSLREVSRKDEGVYTCSVYNPAGITKAKSYLRILAIPCGGFISVLSSNETTLQSPNYPDPFPKDKMCAWRICPPVGKRLEVRFDTFNLRKSDRLEITDECDRQSQPWQTNCGTVSPGTFVSQCNSVCLQMGLASSYRPNRAATGFSIGIKATDKSSTEFDVTKLWCNHDLVVKAHPEELSFDETKATVIENYKEGPPFAGNQINITQDLTVVNIFGCPSYLKYNRHYYMMIDGEKSKLHLKYAMLTSSSEIPKGFVKKLKQYKLSNPKCDS